MILNRTIETRCRSVGCIEIKNLIDMLYFLLLLQCVLYPKYNMECKAITVAVIMILALAQQGGRLVFNHSFIIWGLYLFFNFISTLQGAIHGYAQDAFRRGTVNLIWPMTYFLFNGYYISKERLMKLFRGIVYLTAAVCIADTLLILSDLFGLTFVSMCLEQLHMEGFASASTYVLFRSEHIFFYAFLTPFMTAALTMHPDEIRKSGMSVWCVRVTAVYSIVTGLFSGMGAVWLSMFITAGVCVFRSGVLKRRRAVLVLTILFFPAMCFLVLSLWKQGMVYYILEDVKSRLGAGSVIDSGTIIRANQITAMIREWARYPIFGSGIANPVRYIRDGRYIVTSAFESSYFIILYQRGMVGFVLFFALVSQGMKGLKKRRDAFCLSESFLIGMLGFLIANAFNPYLASLSTIWILFLPLLIGNTKTNRY